MNFFKKAYSTISWPGWVWVMILRKTITRSDALQLALYFAKYQGEGIADLYDIMTLTDYYQGQPTYGRVSNAVSLWVYDVLKKTELN